jgi:hypothetical protein
MWYTRKNASKIIVIFTYLGYFKQQIFVRT